MGKLTSLWESRTGASIPPWTKLTRVPAPAAGTSMDGTPTAKHRWEVNTVTSHCILTIQYLVQHQFVS